MWNFIASYDYNETVISKCFNNMTKEHDKIITLMTFDNSPQAHLFRGILAENNIDSYISDEFIVTLNPLYSNLMGGIKLQVNSLDFEKAQKLLFELNSNPLTNELEEIIKCPSCNSTNVESNYKSATSLKSILAMIVSFLSLTYPLHLDHMYYCKDCKHGFKKV